MYTVKKLKTGTGEICKSCYHRLKISKSAKARCILKLHPQKQFYKGKWINRPPDLALVSFKDKYHDFQREDCRRWEPREGAEKYELPPCPVCNEIQTLKKPFRTKQAMLVCDNCGVKFTMATGKPRKMTNEEYRKFIAFNLSKGMKK